MGDRFGGFVRHVLVAAWVVAVAAGAAFAQGPGTPGATTIMTPVPDEPAFISKYDFHLSAAALSTDDDRFKWEAHFGGDRKSVV